MHIIRLSYPEYLIPTCQNSSEDYFGLISWNFNNTQWGGFISNEEDYLDLSSNILDSEGSWSYHWTTGVSTSFTVDIIIDTSLPLGDYHFGFAVAGYLE